jgi:hypothetical protein
LKFFLNLLNKAEEEEAQTEIEIDGDNIGSDCSMTD